MKETENFYIYLPGKQIFPIGVVYSPWVNQDTGEITNTFSVITVKANPLLEEIHNEKKRMPLILTPDQVTGWMNSSSKEEIKNYFQPSLQQFQAHKVFRITAPPGGMDTNTPEIQNRID